MLPLFQKAAMLVAWARVCYGLALNGHCMQTYLPELMTYLFPGCTNCRPQRTVMEQAQNSYQSARLCGWSGNIWPGHLCTSCAWGRLWHPSNSCGGRLMLGLIHALYTPSVLNDRFVYIKSEKQQHSCIQGWQDYSSDDGTCFRASKLNDRPTSAYARTRVMSLQRASVPVLCSE